MVIRPGGSCCLAVRHARCWAPRPSPYCSRIDEQGRTQTENDRDIVMPRGLTSWSRRDFLAFIASAGAMAALGMSVAARGTGQSDAPSGPGIGQIGAMADRCGVQNAPWLNQRIAEEFERFRPGWAATRAAYLVRCDTMLEALIERQQQGFTCPIADQIYAEARWLAGATSDQSRILARFADFDEAFNRQKDLYDLPPIEQAEDGSWAPYVNEPFHKP